ncbi:ATP-binding protein [Flavobacterium sp.]|jgi:ATP-dependent DNA helicase RecG|uniref:ATP-binding protein n=1 Tax=Flavobacterium sp. TaxID=239 RepID=UPI0037C12B3E
MEKQTFIQELLKKKSELNLIFLTNFDSETILQNICGFLNTDGGWILVGHNSTESIYLDLNDGLVENLKQEVNSQIAPQPLVYIAKDSDGTNDVLLINVLKGSRQPYTLNNKYYVFRGDATIIANQDEISLLLRSSNEYNSTWEKTTAIDCSMNDLDNNEINNTIVEAKKMTKGQVLPNSVEEFLNYFKLSDYGNIKNGAVVLFGKEPAKFLSQCRIRISVLPEGKTGSRIEDTEIIENNLFQAFNRVQDYFSRYNPLIGLFTEKDWDRKSQLKFPNDALDEAIVNAMIHRDYGDISGEITINIYKDKIEIINSGEIPDGIITGKSKIKPHHAVLRNPTIAHMFYLRGKMEKLGRGLTLISDRFVEYGYRKPEWTLQSGYTTLTLFSKAAEIQLNDRMKEFINQYEESIFTRQDYEDYFKGTIAEKTARNDLSKLIEMGILSKTGQGAVTKYERTEKKLPEITG